MVADKILVVHTERQVRSSLCEKCEQWGYRVLEAGSVRIGVRLARNERPDLVLLDFYLPDLPGSEALKQVRKTSDTSMVIVLGARPQLDDLKNAFALGAYDFVTEPLNFAGLRIGIQDALQRTRWQRKAHSLGQVESSTERQPVIGRSPQMTGLMSLVGKIASSDASPILIQGESGTGKSLIAHVIHSQSSRAGRAFLSVNCSAVPERWLSSHLFGRDRGSGEDETLTTKALFRIVEGRTLFLDDIEALSPVLQAKLLRALEGQTMWGTGGQRDVEENVRVIAASNCDLETAVRQGQFREDLYYHLSTIAVFIPPLRDRRDDILPLAEFFIEHWNKKLKKTVREITEETRRLLLAHRWPGNVRELKSALQHAVLFADAPLLRPDHLPFWVSGKRQLWEFISQPAGEQRLPSGRCLPPLYIPEGGTSLEELERSLIVLAMRQSNGNQTRAARLLDISRDALRYKVQKFRLLGAENKEWPDLPEKR